MPLTPEQRDVLATWWSSIVLGLVAAFFLWNWGAYYRILDDFNLIVHESGHFFFHFVGSDILTAAGGSLMQLILPGIVAWSAFVAYSKLGLQAALLWFGESAINVSIYAADAQERALPLIGGLGDENHDWWWILLRLGILEHDTAVAGSFVALAVAAFLLMLVVPKWLG